MAARMPQHLVPMLAKLAKLPADDDRWAYEIKWDGVRAIAYIDGGTRLESRNLKDITPRYPEINAIADSLGDRRAILDGEVVAFDDEGRPSFERLQGRMHLTTGVEAKAKATPVFYMVFDVLWLDGESLMRRPYTERREILASLELHGPAWRTPANHVGNGRALLDASLEQGLEGVMAKRLDSTYEPGKRPGTWLKVKNTRRQELIVGGWLPGEGRRLDRIGALLVGFYDDGELRYAGKVGTGFTDSELDALAERLKPLQRDSSPFSGRQPKERDAQFVEPVLVAEVEFTEWTKQQMLRHPSYKGLRDDKDARDVVLEKVE